MHRVRKDLVKYVQIAETPRGQRYTIVAAPPGSALDTGRGLPAGGAIGALISLVIVAVRSGRRGWRVAVTPCDERGRLTGATHRERVSDEASAEARTEAIAVAIGRGDWTQGG